MMKEVIVKRGAKEDEKIREWIGRKAKRDFMVQKIGRVMNSEEDDMVKEGNREEGKKT